MRLVAGHDCTPFGGAHVAHVLGEEPAVALEVLGSILPFAIAGLIDRFDDGGTGRFCLLVLRVDVFNEDRYELSRGADLGGTGAAGADADEHDTSIVPVHLRGLDGAAGLAISERFAEPEGAAKLV